MAVYYDHPMKAREQARAVYGFSIPVASIDKAGLNELVKEKGYSIAELPSVPVVHASTRIKSDPKSMSWA